MDAKEYLNQARILNNKYRAKQDEITSIEALLLQAVSYGKDGTMSHDNNKNERIILKLMELQDDLNKQLLELMDKKAEIFKTIDKVEDPNELSLLHKRYAQFKGWNQISIELGYSEAQVFRIHSCAIRSVEEILKR